MRVASIDLGSNSFHMLVVQILGPGAFEVVTQDKMMIQLGKMALLTGRLDPRAIEAGLKCLDEFRRLALARRVARTLAVATSAIREAENGAEFLSRARDESGLSVRVISGREEARLIHLAVARNVDFGSKTALLIDIGGGSVELAIGDGSRMRYCTSQKLGFLRMQGRFVSSDPISSGERAAIRNHVLDALRPHFRRLMPHAAQKVIGTSGSLTALLRLVQARRDGGSDKEDRRMSVAEIQDIMEEIMGLKTADRARRFDLDPLRAEYLPTAVLTLHTILEEVGAEVVETCPAALREGLIYDYLGKSRTVPTAPRAEGDLRLQAVIDLASRCDYPIEHSHQVARIAGEIFKGTADLHHMGDTEARLLLYACILHDIGYHIGYAKHHKHAQYLVMNSDLRGFSALERKILANLVRYHRRATPKSSHSGLAGLDPASRGVIKMLTAILRIADGLDRSHFSVVDEIRCVRRRSKVDFEAVTSRTLSELEMDLVAAKKHARYFEKIFGVQTRFTARRPRG